MRLAFSQSDIITTAKSLGLPSDGFVQRRVARAFDLVESNKVSQIDDGIFRVRSQYDAGKSYIVNVNSGEPSCDCPDGERTINCKHRIASLLYVRKQAKQLIIRETTMDDDKYIHRSWIVIDSDGWHHTVVEELDHRVNCTCHKPKCEHIQAIVNSINPNGGNGNGTKITHECGSNEAKALQDQMNGQLGSQKN